MYGEYVTLRLDPHGEIEPIKVWVWCTPKTSKAEKERLAYARLYSRVVAARVQYAA